MLKKGVRIGAGLAGGVLMLGVHRMWTAGLVAKLPLAAWPKLAAFVQDAAAVGQAVIGYGVGHAVGAKVSGALPG